MNPYLITGPAQIGISGGRNSGCMIYKNLEAHGGTLPPDVHLFFQNTGKEREETLVFIDQIAKRWKVNIVWMEWCRVYGQPATHAGTTWLTSKQPAQQRAVHTDA